MKRLFDLTKLRVFLCALIIANLVALLGIHTPTGLPDQFARFFQRSAPLSSEAASIFTGQPNIAGSAAAQVAVSCGAGSKGSYAQVIASTSGRVVWLNIIVISTAESAVHYLDIATGGAGAESVIIPNIAYNTDAGNRVNMSVDTPIEIASGTRIAARCQGSTAVSDQMQVIYYYRN